MNARPIVILSVLLGIVLVWAIGSTVRASQIDGLLKDAKESVSRLENRANELAILLAKSEITAKDLRDSLNEIRNAYNDATIGIDNLERSIDQAFERLDDAQRTAQGIDDCLDALQSR